MSDNPYVAGKVFPPGRAAVPRPEKFLKWFILAAGLLLGAELVLVFLVSPCMPLSRVDINGFKELDRGLILAQAGIDANSSYVSVNPRLVEKALALLPQVESARVTRHFPDSVEILLTERKALAASLVKIDGRQGLVIFDSRGVVFKIGNPADAETAALPLISGLIFEEPRLGTRLPPLFYSFLSRLEGIRNSAPELFSTISEIRINRKAYEGFDLVLYPIHNPVRVLSGAELSEYTLRYMLLMVDVLLSREPRIEEIDFRAGIASYTVKEASSG